MPTATRATTDTDAYVSTVMDRIHRDPIHGLPALEIALLELALFDLHLKRGEILAGAKEQHEAEVKKLSRALAKSYFAFEKTGRDTSKIVDYARIVKNATFITIPEYQRRDGTVVPEHRRRLPEGHTARDRKASKEIRDEIREAARDFRDRSSEVSASDKEKLQRAMKLGLGPIERTAYSVEDVAESIAQTADDEVTKGVVQSFLKESTIGQGIVAVAGFLSHTKNTFQFAARAIKEYGPMVGVRMAHAYFRYGGYDMPFTLDPDGPGYLTELGDELPPIGDKNATRQWAMEVLRSRLPGEEADKAGAQPPSEGFIIGKDGEVLAHGTGRGNDYFLPFSMRHLRKMRSETGVEYVRRRMFGGPTAEDLHVAMMMGADRLTVVSNGGTFSIELSPRSKGLKAAHFQILQRFQDLMAARKINPSFSDYDKVLDALGAEFPLHFKVHKSTPYDTEWEHKRDRIGPRASIMDQLRELFGVETTAQRREKAKEETQSGQIQRAPWSRQGLTVDEWVVERSASLGGDRVKAIQEAISLGQRHGMSPEARRRLNNKLDAALRHQESLRFGVAQTPAQAREAARWSADERSARTARATGEPGAEGWNPVQTFQASPEDIQHRFSRAITAFEQSGHSVEDLTTSQLQDAATILEQVEEMEESELERAMGSGILDDWWEEIRG